MNKMDKQRFLTGYFVAGDPNVESSLSYIKEAVALGIDAIEVGIPSHDPYLEGDVIKRAHSRVSLQLHERRQILSYFKKIKSEIQAPIWAMGYYHDVIQSGLYKDLAIPQLVDGFIIPDLPLDEVIALRTECHKYDVTVIPVVHNGMDEGELNIALHEANVIYCQTHQGKTGTNIDNLDEIPSFYKRVRSQTDAVLMAGFGVKNASLAKQLWNCGFEGVVVGSEIVRLVELQDKTKFAAFIHELSKAKNEKGV